MSYEPVRHGLYRGLSRLHRVVWPEAAGPGLRVLAYHSVGGALKEDPHGTSINPVVFTGHMIHLASLRGPWEFPVGLRLTSEQPAVAITFDDGYKDTLTVACPILVQLGLPLTVFVATSNLEDQSGLYLNKTELRELSNVQGVTIGAHGHAHAALDSLSDAALKEDLSKSRKILEDALGYPVTSMSYPFGRVDRRVRDAAQEAGFTLGACSRYGVNGPDRDPLLMCRTEVVAWDGVDDLVLKTTGHWDWFRHRRPDPQKR